KDVFELLDDEDEIIDLLDTSDNSSDDDDDDEIQLLDPVDEDDEVIDLLDTSGDGIDEDIISLDAPSENKIINPELEETIEMLGTPKTGIKSAEELIQILEPDEDPKDVPHFSDTIEFHAEDVIKLDDTIEDSSLEYPDDDGFADSLGVTFDHNDENDDYKDEDKGINLSKHDLEDALEKVINKMFGDKIEEILSDTIERLVLKEIKKIKDIISNKY
ncbi:MAG: hypothetical protein HQK76_19465, partial [Desulfobacterales bacterium]|nr:hypothetical protein [Desulfobacterales bacterium]